MPRSRPESQRLDAPLTSTATFLTLTVNPTPSSLSTIRNTLSSLQSLTKNVSIRDPSAQFSTTVGISAHIWPFLTPLPPPPELHPFREIRGSKHVAPRTPGDLLFHIRSERRDLNFEFERQLLLQLGDSVVVVDSTAGFRYFDVRDLLGFVDGTANPVGQAVEDAVVITVEDAAAAAAAAAASGPNHGADTPEAAVGGSYILVQKYLHDLSAWERLSTETQQDIVGRNKFSNAELPDQPADAQKPHKQLATIERDGVEFDIVRDNMPFGNPGESEFGTYFIGYSKRLWVVEEMIRRMFVGVPEGKHDRILDYSTAVTGGVFFAPGVDVLRGLGEG